MYRVTDEVIARQLVAFAAVDHQRVRVVVDIRVGEGDALALIKVEGTVALRNL